MPEAASRTGMIRLQGLLFLIAFVVTMVILFTDKNLQTDFGIQEPYFIHWYGLLVTGIVAIIGAGGLLGSPKISYSKIGVVGSILLVIFLISDVALYSMVGFSTASGFATYLFGLSKYPGTLSYIPGLYDALLGIYVVTFVVGLLAARSKS